MAWTKQQIDEMGQMAMAGRKLAVVCPEPMCEANVIRVYRAENVEGGRSLILVCERCKQQTEYLVPRT